MFARIALALIVVFITSGIGLQAQTPTPPLRLASDFNLPEVDFPLIQELLPKQRRVDSNSPAEWSGGQFYLFQSVKGTPHRTAGADLFSLNPSSQIVDPIVPGSPEGRWLEAAIPFNGRLYGWYHHEPLCVCSINNVCSTLTTPKIGAAYSDDNGATWTDLGKIIIPAVGLTDCNSQNRFFAGGNGDFSVVLDNPDPSQAQFLYFLFTSYAADVSQQGIGVARMPWSCRDDPKGLGPLPQCSGSILKWYQGQFSQPGLKGALTPRFPPASSWLLAFGGGFWGPSVHWNAYLGQYVMLLNNVDNAQQFHQEGVYISYSANLADPGSWTTPVEILTFTAPYGDNWYPQVIGDTQNDVLPGQRGTDKLAGQLSRFFVKGQSIYVLSF